MSIYFGDRDFIDPAYKDTDYQKQQTQFINVLRMRTKSLSLRIAEVKLIKDDEKCPEMAFLHANLENPQDVILSFPKAGLKFNIHDLFRMLNQDPDAESHSLSSGYIIENLRELLEYSHDSLCVKFNHDWKLVC